ncbi:MAG: hypothetical protein EOO62_02650 [Hymenobacter sp.]|nr:MAG: hypothetical protein EOO62_02650 [Hymenobacter sp.]
MPAATTPNGVLPSPTTDVLLLGPISVSDTLTLRTGHLVVGEQALALGADATISGADASRYRITRDDPAGLGYVLRPVPATGAAVSFPIGTATSYAPVALSNQGAAAGVKARTFRGLREHGTSGAPYANASRFVNQMGELTPTTSGAVVDRTLHWSAVASRKHGLSACQRQRIPPRQYQQRHLGCAAQHPGQGCQSVPNHGHQRAQLLHGCHRLGRAAARDAGEFWRTAHNCHDGSGELGHGVGAKLRPL